MQLLITVFLAESFLFKTWLADFVEGPVLHYSLSALLCLLLVGSRTIHYGLRWRLSLGERFLLTAIFSWAFLSTLFNPPVIPNIAAAGAFLLLVYSCFLVLPELMEKQGTAPWRYVYVCCATFTIASSIALAIWPNLAWGGPSPEDDPERFRGLMVSTAVACNVFLFSFLFGLYSILVNPSTKCKLCHGSIATISLALLLLTKTRSALAAAVVAAIWLYMTSPQTGSRYSLKLMHVLFAALFIMTVVAAVLVFHGWDVSDLRDDLLAYLRLEETAVTDTREENWFFGVVRLGDSPLFGDGFLAKFTGGGQDNIGIGESTFDQLYDPHSLILYLALVAGFPFLAVFLGLITSTLYRYNHQFDRESFATTKTAAYYFIIVITLMMIPAGGGLVSFGNLIDRVWWLMLGELAWNARIKHMRSKS